VTGRTAVTVGPPRSLDLLSDTGADAGLPLGGVASVPTLSHAMSSTRRFVPFLIAGTALIAAACRDSTVAPVATTPAATLTLLEDQSFSRLVARTDGSGAQTLNFTLTRAAGSVQLGEFKLAWQDNSVCDPATSGYGEAFWRKACAAAPADIPMTVELWNDGERTYAEFSPDIRFSPSKDVTLTVNRPQIVGRRVTPRLVRLWSILYTHQIGDTRYYVDEAWYDLEQRSHFNTITGDVWREIRHFSGFVIRTGVVSEEAIVGENENGYAP
jgi:hypothetical protein